MSETTRMIRGTVMKKWIHVIVSIATSAFIGIAIGIMQILFDMYRPDMNRVLVRNAIIGIIVGTCARFIFVYLYTRFKRNPVLILSLIFVITFIGTASPFIILGESNLLEMALAILIAEVLSLTVCFVEYRYTLLMSRQLDKRKLDFQ